MTFENYCRLITDSARESGYDAFLPSLCSVYEGNIVMHVLDGDLSEDGDEVVAKEWAAMFMQDGDALFLAYRRGRHTLSVEEFRASKLVQAKRLPCRIV
jgi:hypothetical protein